MRLGLPTRLAILKAHTSLVLSWVMEATTADGLMYLVEASGGPSKISLNPKPWVLPPLSNSWIILTIWVYIALNRTPNTDCYWGRAVPNLNPKPQTLLATGTVRRDDLGKGQFPHSLLILHQ